LPTGVDDLGFVAAAAQVGVSLTAGAPWFAAERPAPFVRISTAGASAADLEAGIEKLGAVET
jgi:DNA-binding transcriptional MocR family regulator